MKISPQKNIYIENVVFYFFMMLIMVLSIPRATFSAPVHAFYADEYNTSPITPSGNRILEIDIENMELVNSLNVPGLLGHHADNAYNSKIYGVPKGSNFVNVIELRKGENNAESMKLTKKIKLIHKPRSGDAYNKKFNVVLMVASNRPMGSFINVETDEVVGTIGENVDCVLTDGTKLLSHSDANTIKGATKYHCASTDHGGNQISGHPYWLTSDYAAIIDRANRLISVYYIWQDGSQLKSRFINSVNTRTAVHQIVPRDRTSLPLTQQADFYAVEEGKHANPTDYSGGIPHALLKMKLTSSGLKIVKRMNLQRTEVLPKVKADRILNACIANYRNTNNYRNGRSLQKAYDDLFKAEKIIRSQDQDVNNHFPIDCFYPGIPGGHNADFAPNNKHLYVPMAGGALSVIDVNRWKIANNLDIGIRSGPGHVCFSKKHNLALTTNHGNSATRVIRNINSERPTISQFLRLPFDRENIVNTLQSHTCYIDENEDYYYNFWTDGGVFYKIDLNMVESNRINGSSDPVVEWLYTGGIPIQGSFLSLDRIKSDGSYIPFTVKNDTAKSNGSAITIDVLKNDTGKNLVLEAVDPAGDGVVSIENGKIHYVPNTGFNGTDGFWYGVSSGSSWEWALVTIKVKSSTPTVTLKAFRDIVTISPNTSLVIDVLANDKGNDLKLGWLDDPDSGTASIKNNKLIYSPDSGFIGVDNFWYEVVDASGQTIWGNVVVTVGNAILLENDTATVRLGETVSVDVLANDRGSNLNIISVDSVWTGSATIVNGEIEYIASGNYTGSIDIWHGVSDPSGNSQWAVLAIEIIE